VIIAQPNSNDGPPQSHEGDLIRIDEPWRGDPTTTSPTFLGKEAVSLERKESTTMTEPIRFSNAFSMWLLIGGPLL
jgi:hypothetical protein